MPENPFDAYAYLVMELQGAYKRLMVEISVDDVEIRRAPTKYYVYVIYVSWSDGTVSIVYRRYEDFLLLEKIIQQTVKKKKIPSNHVNLVQLPGKLLLGRNNVQKVALKRLGLLYDYCKVLLNLAPRILEASRAQSFFEPTDLDIRSTLKRPVMEEKRRAGKVNEISTPILEEKYIAIADYNKTGDDQLELKAGDSLQAFIRDESGWWLVVDSAGHHGWVPCSYMEKVDGTEEDPIIKMPLSQAEKYMTVASYEAEYSDEVSLEKGTVIEVVEKTLDGWWLVRSANIEGRAPAVNLAKADSLKVRQALDKASLPDNFTSLEMGDSLRPEMGLFDLDIEKELDDYVDVWEDPDLRKSIRQVNTQDSGGEDGGDTYRSVKEILSLKRRTSNPPPRKRSIKREIASIKDAPESSSIAGSDRGSNGTSLIPSIDEDLSLVNPSDDQADPSDHHDYYNVSPFQKKQSTKERPQFEARSMFKAGDSGETDLSEGEIVPVLEKTGTGWWLVQSSVGVGWVPSHFLKPLNYSTGIRQKNTSEQEFSVEGIQPKIPGHKKEGMKAAGHIANRYLQGGKPERTPRSHEQSTSPRSPPPETRPKPNLVKPGMASPNQGKPVSSHLKPTVTPLSQPKLTQSPKTSAKPATHRKPDPPSKKPAVSQRKPSLEARTASEEEREKAMGVKDLRALFNKS